MNRFVRSFYGACIILVICGFVLSAAEAQNVPPREGTTPPGGIFVPKPRGAEAPLERETERVVQNPDSIRLRNGDVITGNVLSVESGGRARLSGPQFSGEVVLMADAIAQITLRSTMEESGRDIVILKNGDRIQGQLRKISDQNLVIQTAIAGTLTIDRQLAKAIYYAPKEKVLLDVDFSKGRLEPFEIVQGTWLLREGQLLCTSQEVVASVAAPLSHSGPITFRIDYAAAPLNGGFVFFADEKVGNYGRNSYTFICRGGTEVALLRTFNNRTAQVFQHALRAPFTEGVICVTYDPASDKFSAWLGKDFLFEASLQKLNRPGQFLMLFGQASPARIRRVTAIEGVVPPIESRMSAVSDTDMVLFTNGDNLRTKSISYENKELVLTTGFGQIKVTPDKVAAIAFRSDETTSARPKDAAQVAAGGSVFTLRFQKLAENFLLGSSPYLGDMQIQRSAVSQITFPQSQ